MKKNQGMVLQILMCVCLVCSFQLKAHASIILDVFRDGYIEDFSLSGPLDGIPDSISDTNAILAAKGTLSGGALIESRGIISFYIGSYAGSTLSSAQFRGYGIRVDNGASLDPITFDVASYIDDGLVTLDDFNRAASHIGSVSLDVNPLFPSTYVLNPFQLDVTSAMQGHLNSAADYVEFKLTAEQLSALINAGESATPQTVDDRFGYPQLVLDFQTNNAAVPEPGTIFLLGGSLLAAGLARRKKSKS